MKDLKGTGEITVKGYFVKNLRLTENPDSNPEKSTLLDSVPKKALKGRALSHQSE
jgi:hypothetical protein